MVTSQEIFRALGMALIHSLWQGAIIAALVLFMLMLAGKTNARARYGVHLAGLLMLLGSFVTTFIIIFRNNQALAQLHNAMLSLQPENKLIEALPATPAGIFQTILDILEPLSPYFALGWLAGFVITGIRMTGGAVISRISFKRDLSMPDNCLAVLFTSVKEKLGLSAGIQLRISQRMMSPLVTGVLTPMVIIPAAAVTGLSIEQIRSVMIHELAHIRRYDHILILVQAVARLILFFHPLAWYILPEIDRERENCCDDFVLRNNNNPINYIKALTMIQEMNLQGAPANALTGKSNQLLNRIKRLITPKSRHSATFRLAATLLFILTIGILSTEFIISGQPDVKAKKDSPVKIESLEVSSMQLNGTASTFIQGDKDGDKKKKMVIVFDNDTIKEMSVNGKKLSREEMKEYAGDIRKVQQELEFSREDLVRAHREMENAQWELENAHSEMEQAHREMELANRENEFQFKNKLNELNELNELSNEQLKLELEMKHFNLEQFQHQMQSEEFQEKMKEAQDEAMKAFKDAKEKSMEYLGSEEFRDKMKKAQEEVMKAFQDAKEKNKEFFDSHEFREQMNRAQEDAMKAFEELRHPPAIPAYPHVWGHGPQEPPAPRPEIEENPEVPELPEVPEAPEIDEEFEQHEAEEAPEVEIQEHPEIEEMQENEKMEMEEKADSNPESEKLDDRLRELENE